MTPRAILLAYTQINPDLERELFPLYEPLDLVEFAGRWDYGPRSIAKMGDKDIIGRWISSGEESMVEMVDAAFYIECSRVVSHELVRHRLASFQQESQRYVDYTVEDEEEFFYFDPALGSWDYDEAETAYRVALRTYNDMIERGVKRQIARYVLPNGTRVRMVMKANLREWRHILKLRMHKSAQPEIQIVANQVHDALLGKFPEVFGDIRPALEAGERSVR
jgi:thymidylate synthase (FAD)